ncbi:hypothetical protein PV325_004163 [Microctonus aethiopoides]|nr:hypothetical protein PV325_004163 [Microctonus aethiopoides]
MSEVIPAQKSEKSYESLPNETFYIVCGVKSGTEFNIILSKLSPKPAKATIVIFVGEERKDIEIDNWTNKPISDVIPSFIQADQDYDFSCEIIWKGFHDTKLPSSLNLHHHIEKFLEKPDFKDFSNMRETAENQLVVKDIEFDIMKLVIEFMYSGKIDSELPVDDLLCMLRVADIYERKIQEQEKFLVQSEYLKYTQQILRDSTVKFVRQHETLKKLCEEILISKLTSDNASEILENIRKMTELPSVQKSEKNVLISHKWSLESFDDEGGYKQLGIYKSFEERGIGGSNIGKTKIKALKYADDIVIIPEVKKGEDVSDEYTGFHATKLPPFDDVHRHLKHFQSESNFTDSGIKIDNNNISVHKVILNVKR